MTEATLSRYGGPAFRLYDPELLLDLDPEIASGYIVLMGGYPARKKGRKSSSCGNSEESGLLETQSQKLDQGAINLAFLALTEGNVLDACFGSKGQVNADVAPTSRAGKHANEAKKMIDTAVRSSDSVREIAVKCYQQAFRVVLQYNEDSQALNFITRCYRWKHVRQHAENSLIETFRPLGEAIEASI